MNRFENAKTLKDLYNVFNNNNIKYNNITEEESSTIAKVFEGCVEQAHINTPLIEPTFNFIYNYVVNEAEKNLKENKEEVNMENAVNDMLNKFAEAKESIKVKGKRTKEQYTEDCDNALNIMKGAFGTVINKFDTVLGCSLLKDAIVDIVEAGADNRDLFKMAEKCRQLIDREIDNLKFWGDEESLKKAVQLKALTEDERGKCIFESFASGCIHVYNKVADKLSLDNKERNSLFKSICNSISAFAKVLKAGLKIIWSTTKFAVSFIVTGTIKIIASIFDAIMSVVSKIKDWHSRKDEVVEEDDCVEDEEAKQ